MPLVVLVALVVSVLVKTFLVQAFYIPSASMENTLVRDDRVLVNKLVDKPDEIHRGDVVVFRDPGGWLPDGPSPRGGVTGAARRGLELVGLAPAASEQDLIKRVIGVGGDRVVCCDGRHRITVNGAPLHEPYLFSTDVGRPSAQEFAVVVPAGRLWVMGDHRSVSRDSRAHRTPGLGTGFVPAHDVVGRAFTRIWPLDRATLLHRPDTFRQPRLTAAAR